MPRLTQSEIHSDFSTASGTWTGYRAEVTGFYNDYPNSELDAHISREYNRKISNLGQDDSLYLHPYDAGFSYRGDGYNFFDILGNAAAAYSLRSIDPTKDPNVVNVRRSSDGATSDFTASEVSDGTLTDWVNTEYNRYTSDFSSSVDGWSNFAGTTTPNVDSIGGRDDCLRFVINGDDNYHFIFKTQQLLTDNRYRISAEVYLPSSNTQIDQLKILNALGSFGSRDGSNSTTTTDEWVTISFEATGITRVDFLAFANGSIFYQGNGTDTFYVRNIQIDQLTADGHVTTWYDQGGTNHATQSTASAQPKIVDAGTLVTENGQAAALFSGAEWMDISGLNSYTGLTDMSLFGVVRTSFNSLARYNIFIAINNSARGNILRTGISTSEVNNLFLWTQTDSYASNSSISDEQTLIGFDLFSSATGYINGTAYTSGLISSGVSLKSNATWQIGQEYDSGGPSDHFDGKMQEIVIFTNDQSANRTGIENSIMNYYNIS